MTVDKLKDLKALLDSNAITSEEFEKLKREIIGGVETPTTITTTKDKRTFWDWVTYYSMLALFLGTILWFFSHFFINTKSNSVNYNNDNNGGWSTKPAKYCNICGRVDVNELGAYECIPLGERTNGYAKYRETKNGVTCMTCCMNYLCE